MREQEETIDRYQIENAVREGMGGWIVSETSGKYAYLASIIAAVIRSELMDRPNNLLPALSSAKADIATIGHKLIRVEEDLDLLGGMLRSAINGQTLTDLSFVASNTKVEVKKELEKIREIADTMRKSYHENVDEVKKELDALRQRIEGAVAEIRREADRMAAISQPW